MGQPECRVAGGKKNPITMEMWERKRSEYRQGCHYYFFLIHYFHNDCHYVQPLIEILFFFFFASQFCVQKNYHLSDGKTEAKHFHGHCLQMVSNSKRIFSPLLAVEHFEYASCSSYCLLLHCCSVVSRFGHQLHTACTENTNAGINFYIKVIKMDDYIMASTIISGVFSEI